jgi:hypothetical protein
MGEICIMRAAIGVLSYLEQRLLRRQREAILAMLLHVDEDGRVDIGQLLGTIRQVKLRFTYSPSLKREGVGCVLHNTVVVVVVSIMSPPISVIPWVLCHVHFCCDR